MVVFLSLAVSLQADRLYAVYEGSLTWWNAETGAGGVGMGGGINYDAVVSPDNRVLFHFAGEQLTLRNPETLANLPGAGAIFPVPNRVHPITLAASSVALARSGSLLYILKLYSSSSQEDYAVATFDTVNRKMLPAETHLGECQGAALHPLQDDWRVAVVCGGDSAILFLTIGKDGALVADERMTIPPLPVKPSPGPRVGRRDQNNSFVHSALTPDASTLLLATFDGRMTAVDVASRTVTSSIGAPLVPDTRIMSSSPCISPDGKLWYLATGSQANYGSGNEGILVVHVPTFALHSVIKPSRPFSSLAMSFDGKRLYFTEEEPGVIHVVETATGQEVGTVGKPPVPHTVRKTSGFLFLTR